MLSPRTGSRAGTSLTRVRLILLLRPWLLVLPILGVSLGACDADPKPVRGRVLLQPEAARALGTVNGEMVQIDSAAVPRLVRERATRMRQELEGGTNPIRYYPADNGRYVALVPSRSFEGEDPHVIASFDQIGKLIGAQPAYTSVQVYCPAEGVTDKFSSSQDGADGCRYFHSVQPAAEPGVAADADVSA
jgi:hypothetical protein